MTSRNGKSCCQFGKSGFTLVPSSVSRETPGASGEVTRAIPVTMRRNVIRSCVNGGD